MLSYLPTGTSPIIDYFNLVGAIAAALVNLRAARHGFLETRARLYSTAFLAAVYAVAYAILLWTPIQVEPWSNAVRNLGPLAWVVVWIWPAVAVERLRSWADRSLKHREGYEDDEPPPSRLG